MTKEMPHEELLKNLHLFVEASNRGDEAEADRIAKLFPLNADLAMCSKEMFGAEYVRNMGYDLSLAEAAYGKNWLE